MKRVSFFFLFFVFGFLFSGFAADDDKAMMDFISKKGCFACHQIDNKLVGPAWIDVSKKYTEKDIPNLMNSVLNGSQGKWGQVPMPPNKGMVSEEEAKKIVTWIIGLKNKKAAKK